MARSVLFSMFAMLCLSGVPGYAAGQIDFTTRFVVGKLEGPEHEVFGDWNTSAIARDGKIAIGQVNSARVSVFGSDGRHLGTIGRRGAGPGEYRDIGSVAFDASADTLLVYDSELQRVTVLGPDLEHVRDFRVTLATNIRRMVVHSTGNLLFIGAVPGSSEVVHVVSRTGLLLRSMTPLRELIGYPGTNERVASQLSQGIVVEVNNGDIVVATRAPYRVVRMSMTGEVRWILKDDLLPNPWERHIVATKDRYSVAPYPSVFGMVPVDAGRLLVLSQDREHETTTSDVVDLATGKRLTRQPWRNDWIPVYALPAGAVMGVVVSDSEPYPRFASAVAHRAR